MKLTKRADIDAFMRRDLSAVKACLIHGKDRDLVFELGQKIALKIVADPKDPFNASLLQDQEIDSDTAKLEDELSAQSLMGGRRLVRLRFFSEKASHDKIIAQALKAHLNNDYQSDTFFLIEAGAMGQDSGLLRLADADKSMASIALYEDETGDIVRMAREALSQDQIALTPEAMAIFAARLPKERGIARQEIERLCLFIGPRSGKTLSEAELVDFLGVEPEASLFQAALDAFGGRMRPAQACLRRAYAEGEGGADALRALSQHLTKLIQLKQKLDTGSMPKEAIKALRIFWKQETEWLRQAKVWRSSMLETLPSEMIEADRLCKSTGLPDEKIAERLFMSICARAQKQGL